MKIIRKPYAEDVEIRRTKRGRPSNIHRGSVFLEVVDYLEKNDNKQIKINNLVQEMETRLSNSSQEAFSSKHIKRRLIEHFGDRINYTRDQW